MNEDENIPQSSNLSEKESLGMEKEQLDKEKKLEGEEEEEIGQEWWDRNWVWHNRSPYVTGELMDKLEPYIKKLETTPAWQAYDKYLRSIGPFTEELSLEERWKIAKEWYEREDPKAFWKKVYQKQEDNARMRKIMIQRRLRRHQATEVTKTYH